MTPAKKHCGTSCALTSDQLAHKSMNKRLAERRKDGYFDIRVFHRAQRKKKGPRFLFKCGCCDQQLEVYYGDDTLEINGVMGSVANWRELLLPMLQMKLPGQGKDASGARTKSRTRGRASVRRAL
jgi:hypothetical protein